MIVDVIVVAYGEHEGLRTCLQTIMDSANVLPRVVVVDNSPGIGEAEAISASSGATYRRMPGNLGFCRAINSAVGQGTAPYILLMNPDGGISAQYLTRLVDHMEQDRSIASTGGLILRGSIDSGVIDSRGIAILPGRRPVDLGHGEPDDRFRIGLSDVFGVTAAAALYRRSALDAVRLGEQVLAEDFFMYMDDVDLAWRLRLAGYRSVIDHAAIAWHARTRAGGIENPNPGLRSWVRKAVHEARRPDYVRVLSASNLLLTIVRNDDPTPFLRQLHRFVLGRLPADAWMAAQRPAALVESRHRFLRLLPAALEARREIQARRAVNAREMARWLP